MSPLPSNIVWCRLSCVVSCVHISEQDVWCWWLYRYLLLVLSIKGWAIKSPVKLYVLFLSLWRLFSKSENILRFFGVVAHVLSKTQLVVTRVCCIVLVADAAVGCLDVRPPDDAWMRRVGPDTVEIGCYMSRKVWVLRCVDSQFVGVIGNCTTRRQSVGSTYTRIYTSRPSCMAAEKCSTKK